MSTRPDAQTIDRATLTEFLDGADGEPRHTARNALTSMGALDDSGTRADYRARVRKAMLTLTDAGITTAGLPREYGGGGDLRRMAAAFEVLAFGDLSVLIKTGVQFGLFGGAIVQLGTTDHYRRYLPDIAAGRLLGCFAMTEIGHGSDVQSIRTTATFDPASDEFVLHTPDDAATKEFIGNAACDGQMAVVFAQLHVSTDEPSYGVHAFVTPLRDAGRLCDGVSITDDGRKIGLDGVDNGRIAFDHVRIPRSALLDRYAHVDADGSYHSPIDNPDKRFFTMLGTLVQGRVSISGAAVSASEKALAIAIEYGLARRQFADSPTGRNVTDSAETSRDDVLPAERLLLDHRLHRRRLFPLLARSYAFHVAQQQLRGDLADVLGGPVQDPDTWQPDTGAEAAQRRRALETDAAGMKALATWHATRTIQQCREACGGAGYMWRNGLGALRADTDVFTTFEGDNHVLLQLVGKSLLTASANQFADLDPLGTIRWVAGQAWEQVAERTSAYRLFEWIKDVFAGDDGWDTDAGLREKNYHLAMLTWREDHQLASLAQRIKHHTDAGESTADVFQLVQPHVVACGYSHVERVVFEDFAAAVETMAPSPERDAMTLLRDLYALCCIEDDRAWWMEHGRLTADRSKDITRLIDELCDQVRPLAADLVAGFGIPADFWHVPMISDNARP